MKRWIMLVLALAIAAPPALAQSPEQKKVSLGVGGMTALYYLPLVIGKTLGYFKEQRIEVEVSDFKGGSQALTALVGGSADVVTGAYEHTIRMQAKGQDIVAVIELGRYPAIAVGVRKDRADAIRLSISWRPVASVWLNRASSISITRRTKSRRFTSSG